jgi:uncharacterized caspase-like protein
MGGFLNVRLIALAITLCLATTQNCLLTARGGDRALVIGVNECKEFVLPDGSRAAALRGAQDDARAFALFLEQDWGLARDRVTLLVGEKANFKAVSEAFATLKGELKPADRFVFYFAGHGTQLRDRKPFDESDDDLDEGLCLADSLADGSNVLLDDEIAVWFSRLEALQSIVVLDCCHSGTLTKDPADDLVPRFLPAAAARTTRGTQPDWVDLRSAGKEASRELTALFACRPEQQAYERKILSNESRLRTGQFTHYLLEGLTENRCDSNRDGQVSRQEAIDWVTARIDESFNRGRTAPGARQQPLLESPRPEAPLFVRP